MVRRARSERPLRFEQRLVLYQWILNLFEISSFDKLAEGMKEPEQEGFDEDNVTRFHNILNARLFDRKELYISTAIGAIS